jgi:hypothetical protein
MRCKLETSHILQHETHLVGIESSDHTSLSAHTHVTEYRAWGSLRVRCPRSLRRVFDYVVECMQACLPC